MRMHTTLLFLSTMVCLSACRDFSVDPDSDSSPDDGGGIVQEGTPFELLVGSEARIAGTDVYVEFSLVTEDSRCPLGVACISAGRASILLTIKNGQSFQRQLVAHIPGLVATPFRLNDIIQFENYRYRLLRLDPYPSETATSDFSNYKALIEVESLF